MKLILPDWLKTDPFACHVPVGEAAALQHRTIFQPQRRITYRNSVPCLLDVCEQTYPLSQCDRLRLEYLKGVALFITPNQVITIYPERDRLGPNGLVFTDGKQKVGVRIPGISEERLAAESLAEFFGGVIVEVDC